MPWETTFDLDSIKQNNRQTTVINGKKILVIWHDEQVYAIDAQCPHLKLPLLKADINEHCQITCPFHKSVFDLNTGKTECWSPWPPVVGPLLGKISKPKDLNVYPTRIEDGKILIEV